MWLLDVIHRNCEPIPGQGVGEWYEHEFWAMTASKSGSLSDNTKGSVVGVLGELKAYHNIGPRLAITTFILMDRQWSLTEKRVQGASLSAFTRWKAGIRVCFAGLTLIHLAMINAATPSIVHA